MKSYKSRGLGGTAESLIYPINFF